MDMSVARIDTADLRPARPAPALRAFFKIGCILIEVSAVVAAALVSHLAWQMLPFATPTSVEYQMRLGLAVAFLVAVIPLLRNEYRAGFYVGHTTLRRAAAIWNIAFMLLFVVAFATRRTEEASRGAVVLFYITGLIALWGARAAIARLIGVASKLRLILDRRILVVGTEPGIASFGGRYLARHHGYEIVGAVAIRSSADAGDPDPGSLAPGDLALDLHRAVEIARIMNVADVYIAVPWSETETIDRCVEAFLAMPIAIHLAPEPILDRFDRVSLARVGPIASLELTRPMSGAAIAAKRATDLVLAGVALILLLPLFAVLATLIKLDSPGPVFFRQTRYGFNQRQFRIVKFRTMTCLDDGPVIRQATQNDTRVTRIGRFLRRTNLDELPQLLNVVMGQMSLVGPRPHAVPHNRAYERRIALYARRHNVRPGITGWAQVNGLRGETDTDDKMRRRVEHDLYYIDNWSMLLDLRIIVRTIVSPKAYRNAR